MSDIKIRWEALFDIRMAIFKANLIIPNPAIELKRIIEEKDLERLTLLEEKDAEYKAEFDATAYIEQRKREYPSLEELVVAMWENDPVQKAELEARRQVVKAKYPPP